MKLSELHIGNVYLTSPKDEPDVVLFTACGPEVEVPGLDAEQLQADIEMVLASLKKETLARRQAMEKRALEPRSD